MEILSISDQTLLRERQAERYLCSPQMCFDRSADRLRLLEDLLVHEMPVATEARRTPVPVHLVHDAFDQNAVRIENAKSVARQLPDVAIFQVDHVTRVREKRSYVGRDEVLPLTDAHDERRARTSKQYLSRMIRVHTGERILSAHAANRRAERDFVVSALGHHLAQQHRKALCVCLAAGRVPVLLQFATDAHEVFEYAVVNDRDLAVQTGVGMSVLLGRSPMRRPARVANSYPRRKRMAVELAQLAFEIPQSVRGPCDLDGARGVKKRNSRAVVPAIFELPKAPEQNRSGFLTAEIRKNSAHRFSSRVSKQCALPSQRHIARATRRALRPVRSLHDDCLEFPHS